MSNVIRHKTNPFLDEMNLKLKGKSVRISQFGSNNEVEVVNKTTGKITGTHLVTTKPVDSEEFVKIFSKNVGFIFDLRPSGVKALQVLISNMQAHSQNDHIVSLDKWSLEEWNDLNQNKIVSLSTFTRGIKELENAKIIAKTLKKGSYFINPNFLFNGDRVAFSTVIERKKTETLDHY